MRDSCLNCCRKHLAQAHVLLDEVATDPDKYWMHMWYAVGHMAEAESETVKEYPDFARAIRDERLKLMESDEAWPDLNVLIAKATELAVSKEVP